MNTVSRTITGAASILLGLFLSVLSIMEGSWLLIYGIPLTIIGIFIFFNKKEDNIEEIRNSGDTKEV